MIPLRGLSISAIRKNEIAIATGNTESKREDFPCAWYSSRALQNVAVKSRRIEAAIVMRFGQAAAEYPSAFKTSFMPDIPSAEIALACVLVAGSTADQRL